MDKRPKPLHPSKSFTRLESGPSRSPLSRSRASTLQGPPVPPVPPVPEILFPQHTTLSPEEEEEKASGDLFSTKGKEEDDENPQPASPDSFEELPIEIRSLTERFLESLSAKVHPTPITADDLSDLFQDFYTRASSHIGTHIATLSSRLSRDSASKKSAAAASKTARKASGQDEGETQMITASELAYKKKARRLLELKRAALEESVERAVCEKIYDKLWRHRSTDDEERDYKLRSRTAALSLVGIGLKELLMTAEELSEEEKQKTKDREGEIREWLSTAREDIQKMDLEKCPLGKLHHLTTAHKSIVEALSKIFPATSSADEILPTLIYTIITSPPESVNVVSNLKFIQRFRGANRIDGETAYCLVNLEAAISFLETVDLSSLRAEENAEKAGSRPATPKTDVTPMQLGLAQSPDMAQNGTASSDRTTKLPPSPTNKAQRRLSSLIQAQTNRIEAASDAVKESIMDSADQALGTIQNTLDSSFKFLFGRIKEQHPTQSEPTLPKTLEDARKLVSSPPMGHIDDMGGSAASSAFGDDREEKPKDVPSKMSDLFGGRRPIRDRSVDSVKSSGSGSTKAMGFAESKPPSISKVEATSSSQSSATNAAVESMRNLGNTLNPLNRFAGMNMIPRFGRTTSTPAPSAVAERMEQPPSPPVDPRSESSSDVLSGKRGENEAKASAALEALKKTPPPVKRFLEVKDAKDLRIGEIDQLLKEYQRLADALRQAINH